MKKDIKDYLHLYYGCNVQLVNEISEDYNGDNWEAPGIGSIGKLALINNGFQVNAKGESKDWPYGVWLGECYICFWDTKDLS